MLYFCEVMYNLLSINFEIILQHQTFQTLMQANNTATTIITVLNGMHYAKEIEARSYQK